MIDMTVLVECSRMRFCKLLLDLYLSEMHCMLNFIYNFFYKFLGGIMKNLRNVMVLLLLAVFVVGCSPTSETSKSEDTSSDSMKSENEASSNSDDPLQTVLENNPNVKKSLMGLPKEFQKKVFVPQLNTIPFVVDSAEVFTMAEILPPGVKTNFDIILKSKNNLPRVQVIAFDVDGQKPSFGVYTDKVKLKNDVEGYYTDKQKEISWLSSDETVQYFVQFKEGKNKEASISKDELKKIADSMINQMK